MSVLAFSEACERNKKPILEVLVQSFAERSGVLEIGSGTGQHAVHFSKNLRHLRWQPSELPEYLPDLRERLELEAPANVAEPMELDVSSHPWLDGSVAQSIDAVFTANTLHIMSWSEVGDFFSGIGEVFERGGILCIYGPFRYARRYTSDSNETFDRFLQQRDPLSGIRDIEAIADLADEQGLRLLDDHNMPANNQLLVWEKQS